MNDLEKEALNWELFALRLDCANRAIIKNGFKPIGSTFLIRTNDNRYVKDNMFPFSYLLDGVRISAIQWHLALDRKFGLKNYSSYCLIAGFNNSALDLSGMAIYINTDNAKIAYNIGLFFRSSYIDTHLCIDRSIIPGHLRHIKIFQ
jgi:hypothetical protein